MIVDTLRLRVLVYWGFEFKFSNVSQNVFSPFGQNLLICIEMFLVAVAHHFAYSHRPFVLSHRGRGFLNNGRRTRAPADEASASNGAASSGYDGSSEQQAGGANGSGGEEAGPPEDPLLQTTWTDRLRQVMSVQDVKRDFIEHIRVIGVPYHWFVSPRFTMKWHIELKKYLYMFPYISMYTCTHLYIVQVQSHRLSNIFIWKNIFCRNCFSWFVRALYKHTSTYSRESDNPTSRKKSFTSWNDLLNSCIVKTRVYS